jgi:two-component system sensor histidine kinase/response regulator
MEPVNAQELWDRVGGDRVLLSELSELFRDDYPKQIQAAQEALGRADSRGFEQAAHSLKGTLANLSATVACRLAAELEVMGRSGHLEKANSGLTELEQELRRVAAALDNLCQGPDTRVVHPRSSS